MTNTGGDQITDYVEMLLSEVETAIRVLKISRNEYRNKHLHLDHDLLQSSLTGNMMFWRDSRNMVILFKFSFYKAI